MSSQPVTHVGPEEYLKRERATETKHEYIDGQIVAMAGGSPAHTLITANVARELGNLLSGSRCLVFSSDLRVTVRWDRLITYPDVTVVCRAPQYADEKRDTVVDPTFIVEVLSPTNKTFDRGEKGRL